MTKTFKQQLEEKGWKFYGDDSLVLPYKKPKGKVELFTVGKYITEDELEAEYEKRGLVPAHPMDVLNLDSEEKYIGTHWKKDGEWCWAIYHRWDDGRRVDVRRNALDWSVYWWFAGVRKSDSALDAQPSSDTRLRDFVSELKSLIEKYEN